MFTILPISESTKSKDAENEGIPTLSKALLLANRKR
jgi:hypothetical protein